ncbi:hypothetical protein [Agriterribacter sp.]|uniref:hypothetical protein n=1 Tax=Agriterribacter sp. TaxID=2821509 RepID=UPI002BBE313A|nr:hypothetical protein [Agriterribacter sp.]HRO47596.1 hypothetical protein [Agriterribacter sp.]HRQ18695.1 hypothetical protein [Agriterribacter sp.]
MKSIHFNLRKAAVLATISFCLFAFKANAQDETKTVSGEVLDMACYMAKGAHGEKHKGCAAACIKDGAPMGLLTSDGKIYLLVENHNKKEVYAKIKDRAGEKITVTGTASVKGGLQGLVVEELKEKS